MARLYSDLLDGTGRRYYFGQTSAPGGITNAAPAMLMLFGNSQTIQEQSTVFRTPATALLTLIGLSSAADPHLQPATAILTLTAQVPGMAKSTTITNALPPDYTALPDNAPTIIYIATITPNPSALVLTYPLPNATQGGNIGFVSPGKATLTLFGYGAIVPFFSGNAATLSISGFSPTLVRELLISPVTGAITLRGQLPALMLPFRWVEEDRPSTPLWVDDPRA